jgi:hypothetical protein
VIAVVAVFGLVTLGGVGFAVMGGSPSFSLREWYGYACAIDANGDDTLDLVGRAAMPGGGNQSLTVLDGKTGAELWGSEATYTHETPVLCLGTDDFAVAYPDFRLELWKATGREPTSTLRLSDTVSSWGRADNCASFQTADGLTVLDLATAKQGEGAADVPAPHRIHDVDGYFPVDSAMVEHEGTHYSVVAKKPGAPLLTVRANRAGTPLWEAKLPVQMVDSSGIHLAVSDDAVLTYGVKPGDDDYGILVALEQADGRVRFQERQASHWSTNFARTFVLNGQYLIMTWGFGVHAYDLQTGKRAWNLGGR